MLAWGLLTTLAPWPAITTSRPKSWVSDILRGTFSAIATRDAAARDCDLIIMASHGRRGIKRLILGSQTAEVVAHSHAAVLVVK
jgi:nucleotide-binding universal stress UspA family protein